MTTNKQRPAYFVASHQVLDRETLNEIYVPKAVDCLNKFDVEILVVNESVEVVEGQTGHDRLVILRFPSRDEAMRWYHSPEYQSMIHLRLNSVDGFLLLAEGLTPEDLASAERMEGQAALAAAPPAQHSVSADKVDSFRSGELTTSDFEGWSEAIKREFKSNNYSGEIGTDLVFENDRVRVWHMTLQPGQTMPVHRHVLTYFWTAIMPGRFLQRTYDGTTYESNFQAGLTHFYDVGWGEFALHNLENVGHTEMIFCAVELKKESRNLPLTLHNCRPQWGPGAAENPAASTSAMVSATDSFRSGELTTSGFEGWSEETKREFRTNEQNGRIGTDLVFENDSVRVWHMTLKPGDKMPVHRHVLTYFWTAITPGRFLQRTYDGTTYESDVEAGLTHFYDVGSGEFALHNLENVGTTTMVFCAVELKKESRNSPLPI